MDKSAPSKESLERARIDNNHVHYTTPIAACDKCTCLALEFDAIRRERDEVTEKLAEALQAVSYYVDHLRSCGFGKTDSPDGDYCTCQYSAVVKMGRDALAAYRERMGR